VVHEDLALALRRDAEVLWKHRNYLAVHVLPITPQTALPILRLAARSREEDRATSSATAGDADDGPVAAAVAEQLLREFSREGRGVEPSRAGAGDMREAV
jgi:hypothetical protein